MKMHTGEKPHECDLCGKTFSRKILLKEHVKNHHKGIYYQCDFSASFGTKIQPHSQSPQLDQRNSEKDKGRKMSVLKATKTNDIIQLMHSFEVHIRICQPEKVMSTEAKRRWTSLSRVD